MYVDKFFLDFIFFFASQTEVPFLRAHFVAIYRAFGDGNNFWFTSSIIWWNCSYVRVPWLIVDTWQIVRWAVIRMLCGRTNSVRSVSKMCRKISVWVLFLLPKTCMVKVNQNCWSPNEFPLTNWFLFVAYASFVRWKLVLSFGTGLPEGMLCSRNVETSFRETDLCHWMFFLSNYEYDSKCISPRRWDLWCIWKRMESTSVSCIVTDLPCNLSRRNLIFSSETSFVSCRFFLHIIINASRPSVVRKFVGEYNMYFSVQDWLPCRKTTQVQYSSISVG